MLPFALGAVALLLPWPFGPHVAGLKYKTTHSRSAYLVRRVRPRLAVGKGGDGGVHAPYGKTEQVMVHWVPAHRGVAGNEVADDLAKQAAGGPSREFSEVPDQVRWQVSLSHLHRMATEQRSGEPARRIDSEARPERHRTTPQGST